MEIGDNKIRRIDLDGKLHEFLPDAGHANSLTVGPEGQLYAVSSKTGKIMSYDASGKGSLVVDGLPGQHLLATPERRNLRHHQGESQASGRSGS